MSTNTAEDRNSLRDDDTLVAELLDRARHAMACAAGHSSDDAATNAALRNELRGLCQLMADAAAEVSETFRNWRRKFPGMISRPWARMGSLAPSAAGRASGGS